MKHVCLILALFAVGCGSETEAAPTSTTDTGVAPADTGLLDTGSATIDTGPGVMTDAPATDAPATGTVSLSGNVTRKAGTKPNAGGKGNLYIALFDGNPISDMKGAKLVGRVLIENVDMNPDTVSIPYKMDGIPPSSTERQVVAFLDDNKTATEASPAPDKGDLVTIEIPAFSGVKVKIPADTKLDLQLNAAIPVKRVLLAVVALLGCSSNPAEAVTTYSADCRGLDEAKTFDCTEQRFWKAFQQPALEPRRDIETILIRVIAEQPAAKDRVGLSHMHFRLGQIRLAMALENGQRDYMLKASETIIGEFDRAMEIDPSNGIIAPWKDTMEMAIYAVLGDWDGAVKLADRGFANVSKNPMGNTLSLSGTTIGFPLSTNVPQRTVALLDTWKCEGPEFCKQNTAHSPWARPGLAFHFAEAYARVGNREKAKQYLAESLAAAGADKWPYRQVAADAEKDLDGFLKKFADRGNDKGAFDIAYANQPWGCLFCHEQR